MKQFDLERALAGDEVETRDRRKVEQFHIFTLNGGRYLYGILGDILYRWTVKGDYLFNEKSTMDLFMKPKTKVIEGWVNVYLWGFSSSFDSRESAILLAQSGRLDTIKITTEVEI